MLSEVEDFRAEIEKVDSEILELIRKRMEIVKKLARVKASLGLEIRDPARERAVLDAWVERARARGVPEDLARSVAELLIKYSRLAQRPAYHETRRVAIIGYGGVARSLGRLMVEAGHVVTISGRDSDKAESLARELGCNSAGLRESVEQSDYVILALSRSAFESGFVDSILEHVSNAVVMDVLSAKSGVFERLSRLSLEHGFSYISTHPLFYPIELPYGEKIVLIPSPSGLNALPEVVAFWESLGLEVVIASLDEHEKAMTVMQVIPHLFMLALIETQSRIAEKLEVQSIERFETRNMRRLRESLEMVTANLKTIMEIQKHNPHASLAREEAVKSLIGLIERIGGETLE
ncbi:MAG: prephenate dehydrogenase/arogenate dehydrogenase family protein [Acidilobaceae archaeon]